MAGLSLGQRSTARPTCVARPATTRIARFCTRQVKMVRVLHCKMKQCRPKLRKDLTQARHLNTNHNLAKISQFLLRQPHQLPRRSPWSDRAVKMSRIAEKEAPMPRLCPLRSAGLIQMRLSYEPEELARPPAGHLQVHKFPTPLLQVRSRKKLNQTKQAAPQPTRYHHLVRRRPYPRQQTMRPPKLHLCRKPRKS